MVTIVSPTPIGDPVRQAYGILRVPFTIIPIVAGLIAAFAPRIGGWIVAIWLWSIIMSRRTQEECCAFEVQASQL